MGLNEKTNGKDDKMRTFLELLNKKGVHIENEDFIHKVNDTKMCKLSLSQQRIYFMESFAQGGASYNIPIAYKISGCLDRDLVQRCFNEIVKRHEILRTVFIVEGGVPYQLVNDEMQITIETVHLNRKDMSDAKLQDEMKRWSQFRFDLTNGPLMKVSLYELDSEEHLLLFNIHHIVADSWSMGIILNEFRVLYEAYRTNEEVILPALPIQYKDYAMWQEKHLMNDKIKKELEYWVEQLKDAPPLFDLPFSNVRQPIQGNEGTFIKFTINSLVTKKLREVCLQERVSLYMLLMSLFDVLLYCISKTTDLSIGTPVAGRLRPELKDLIGIFINTLVIRTKFMDTITVKQLINVVKKQCLRAYEHQEVPFERLVEELNPDRDMSYSPLFQVMFTMQNTPLPELDFADLKLEVLSVDSSAAQYDLSVTVWEDKDEIKGTFEYNTSLITEYYACKMLEQYQRLIDNVDLILDTPLRDLEIVSPDDKALLFDMGNGAKRELEEAMSIYQLFKQQVQKAPNNIAVIYNHQEYTYGEIDDLSEKLMARIKYERHDTSKVIAILLESSVEFIVAVLAILKSGLAYVPIDPDYPQDRRDFILKDTNASIVITDRVHYNLVSDYSVLVVDEAVDMEAMNSYQESDYSKNIGSNSVACIIYTSGTTGYPKGVLLEQRGITNLIHSFIESYAVNENDRVLPITSVGSSSFVGEILPILCCGGSLVLISKNDILNLKTFVDLISIYGVTIISTVPSMISILNNMKFESEKLRIILCGGEALFPKDVAELMNHVTIVNGYGVTESSICTTYHIVDKEDSEQDKTISIGKPIINSKVYVLSRNKVLAPVGCYGEIYIGGIGLAAGYLNNEELTSQVFVKNPYVENELLYKTGDLGYWNPDGTLHYIGRADTQVKIRGFRIELSEIQSKISKHPAINTVHIILKESGGGDRYLNAFVVLKEGQHITQNELRKWLVQHLPEYMIPANIIFIDELPLNLNGKVDVSQLSSHEVKESNTERQYYLPQTDLEKVIAEVWSKVLEKDKVGIDDNFFDIGGHSLYLIQVHSCLRERIGKELSVVDMFRYPTIRLLAEYIEKDGAADCSDIVQKSRERAKRQRGVKHNNYRERIRKQ